MRTLISTDSASAAELLRQDELVAIPTETVYGLAANGLNEEAVRKIFDAKQLPAQHPLVLHVTDAEQLSRFVRKVAPLVWQLLDHFTPGPLTLLLPKHSAVPDLVTGGLPDVAVRIPQHPLALSLLRQLNFPLAVSSANRSGSVSSTQAEHVREQLDGRVPFILDGGPCQRGLESTVLGFEGGVPVVFRPGAVLLEDLQRVAPSTRLQHVPRSQATGGILSAPRYAPHTPLRLQEAGHLQIPEAARPSTGVLAFQAPVPGVPTNQQVVISPSGDLAEAARNLYAALHRLDAMGLTEIVAERVPDKGLGVAINDRLTRAAHPARY